MLSNKLFLVINKPLQGKQVKQKLFFSLVTTSLMSVIAATLEIFAVRNKLKPGPQIADARKDTTSGHTVEIVSRWKDTQFQEYILGYKSDDILQKVRTAMNIRIQKTTKENESAKLVIIPEETCPKIQDI